MPRFKININYYIILVLIIFSCDDNENDSNVYEFYPLSVGNFWVYENFDNIYGITYDTVKVEIISQYFGYDYFKLSSTLDTNYNQLIRFDDEYYYSLIGNLEFIIFPKNIKERKEILIENPFNINLKGACLNNSDAKNIDILLTITGEKTKFNIKQEFRSGFKIYSQFIKNQNIIYSNCNKYQYLAEGVGLIYTEWLDSNIQVAYSKLIDFRINK